MAHGCFSAVTILLLVGSALSSVSKKCDLSGTWKNELGSTMTITSVEEGGVFSGSYQTGVTATANRILPSPLSGIQQKADQPNFGLTVYWTFSKTITVFSGQCFVDSNGKEVLKTTWLLRDQVASEKEDWRATRIGTNVFTRLQ